MTALSHCHSPTTHDRLNETNKLITRVDTNTLAGQRRAPAILVCSELNTLRIGYTLALKFSIYTAPFHSTFYGFSNTKRPKCDRRPLRPVCGRGLLVCYAFVYALLTNQLTLNETMECLMNCVYCRITHRLEAQ